jgi:hypothetical protein
VIIGGSPMYELDFIEKKIKEAEDLKSGVLARRRNTWDSKHYDWDGDFFYVDTVDRIILKEPTKEQMEHKDTLKIPNIPYIYRAFRANVTKALRDYGGRPSASINSFFETPKVMIERINEKRKQDPVNRDGTLADWVKPVDPNAFHAIHIDLALTGDACGFALGHYDGLDEDGSVKVYIDLMMRIKGSQEAPIRLGKVRDYIYALTDRGFNIDFITYDGFESADSKQTLESRGYRTDKLSVDRTMGPYLDFKEAIMTNRIDYYCVVPNDIPIEERLNMDNDELTASEVFIKESMKLEEVKGKKIDHPPKGSKDVADAVCGVVYNVITRKDEGGEIEVWTS